MGSLEQMAMLKENRGWVCPSNRFLAQANQ